MLIQWVPLSSHFNTGCIAKTNTWFGGKKKHSIWIICMAESIANYDPGGNGEKNTLRCTLSISKVSSTEAGAPFRIGIHWKYCSFYESDEASRFRAPWNVSLDADCSIRSNWRRSILRLFVCFFCLASVSGGLEWSLDRSRLRWENFPRAKILFTDFALFRVQAMEIQGLDRCRFPVYRSLRLVTEIKIGWGFFFQQRPSGKDPRCLFLVESVR